MKSSLVIPVLGASLISLLVTASNIPSSLKTSRYPAVENSGVKLDTVMLNLRAPIASPEGGRPGGGSGTTSGGAGAGGRKTASKNKEDAQKHREADEKDKEKESPHEGGENKPHEVENGSHAENESGQKEGPDKPFRELSPLNCQEAPKRKTGKQPNGRATATVCASKTRFPTATRHPRDAPATTLLTVAAVATSTLVE